MTDVRILYRRPPDRMDTFVQRLVHRTPDVLVTYLDRTPLRRPVEVRGCPVLEDGSPVIWFTFPGMWHDIGRFHRADGTFTGIYANILTPVRFLDDDTWETTDLFLDVWLEPGHDPVILDEDEFAHAVEQGWMDESTIAAARAEAHRIVTLADRGAWPPPPVHEWTLERVRRQANEDPE
jgi:predicted RNA-binding protein associated with RNAse of E/G family